MSAMSWSDWLLVACFVAVAGVYLWGFWMLGAMLKDFNDLSNRKGIYKRYRRGSDDQSGP
jgi:hypothetical protein